MVDKNKQTEKTFSNFQEMVNAQAWKHLVRNSLPVNITDTYSFSEIMHIINHLMDASVDEMMLDGFVADLMRDYSVNLMKILRAKYPDEWKRDWKNEAYLGITCGLVFREEEAFLHIQKAYMQLEDPPQSLILMYIVAGSGADHFLTNTEITALSQKAISKGTTYESALQMAGVASDQQNTETYEYWENEALEAERKGIHTPIIVPNVLKKAFNKKGYTYED